jgi:MFS family permease
VLWVVGLATLGLLFDGYDLVVYGTVVSVFLRNPNEIGPVTPQIAGALGSYALVGVLGGALLAGTVGDILGRRKVMLTAYAWFSVGMAFTALTSSASLFGDVAVDHWPWRWRPGRHDRGLGFGMRAPRKEKPGQRPIPGCRSAAS